MRARSAHIPALLLAAVTASLLATSCSRDLPTAVSRTSGVSTARDHGQRFDGSDVSGQVVVTLAAGVDPADVAASYGASVLHWNEAEGVASLLPSVSDPATSLLGHLAGDPRVSSFEPNSYLQTAESRQRSFAFDDGLGSSATYVEQPAAAALHLLQAHEIASGFGVKVAILDTGIDPTHPALAGRIAAAYDFVRDQPGADETLDGVDSNGDGVLDGAWGHGTHVAGIVLLTAPEAQLIVGRVLDSDGVGDIVTVAAGIRWAVAEGANVINLSLGTLEVSSAIAQAIGQAEDRGVIVVTSAGTWGAEFPHEYPASDRRAIAVAAADVDGTPATWTSYATYVKVCAPGIGIRSTSPGGGYRLWSGTSMAAPFVAGTAALLRQLHPGWQRPYVVSRMASFAAPLQGVSADQLGKLGSGLLDTGATLAPDNAEVDAEPIMVPPTRR
jgi:subtilisin family serine protease